MTCFLNDALHHMSSGWHGRTGTCLYPCMSLTTCMLSWKRVMVRQEQADDSLQTSITPTGWQLHTCTQTAVQWYYPTQQSAKWQLWSDKGLRTNSCDCTHAPRGIFALVTKPGSAASHSIKPVGQHCRGAVSPGSALRAQVSLPKPRPNYRQPLESVTAFLLTHRT